MSETVIKPKEDSIQLGIDIAIKHVKELRPTVPGLGIVLHVLKSLKENYIIVRKEGA
jgi:hypothetical protein